METIVKSTQEQAVASWIDYLNQLRLDEFIAHLNSQDISLESALAELEKLKQFVGNPEHILGSAKTKHGEIAENAQVYISNARKLVEGLKAEYTFEGVGRTAPEDYLRNGAPIQSKFYVGPSGNNTFNAIKSHLEKYPDFIKNGGKYEIPKDQYEKIIELLNKPSSQLSRSEATLVHAIRDWETANNISFTQKVNPTVVNYSEVQQGTIEKTIQNEENSIKETDRQRRDMAYQESKPSLEEGAKASVVSAALEGGVTFCMAIVRKRKEGKRLLEFTSEDWADVGTETGKGTLKGAIRGAGVYTLTNFTATPANVASAFLTAVFGVSAQANALRKGQISKEDFLVNSETLCLDVTVSAVASLIGQVAIPVPVLGALIGNVAGMFMYEIAKNYGMTKEQALISEYQAELRSLNQKLDNQFQELMHLLEKKMKEFSSLVELAFNTEINQAFSGSIELARFNGVEEHKILKDKTAVDAFFLT